MSRYANELAAAERHQHEVVEARRAAAERLEAFRSGRSGSD